MITTQINLNDLLAKLGNPLYEDSIYGGEATWYRKNRRALEFEQFALIVGEKEAPGKYSIMLGRVLNIYAIEGEIRGVRGYWLDCIGLPIERDESGHDGTFGYWPAELVYEVCDEIIALRNEASWG